MQRVLQTKFAGAGIAAEYRTLPLLSLAVRAAPVIGCLLAQALLTSALPALITRAGMLELRGGVKCVLRRTDHGQPEWIKAG